VPTWQGTLAPPGQWRRCGLLSNYSDNLLVYLEVQIVTRVITDCGNVLISLNIIIHHVFRDSSVVIFCVV